MELNRRAVRDVIGKMVDPTLRELTLHKLDTNVTSDDYLCVRGQYDRRVAAVSVGAVFVYPRSLYRELRDRYGHEYNGPSVSDVQKCRLPFDNCLLIEIADDTGLPSAAILATDEFCATSPEHIHAHSISMLPRAGVVDVFPPRRCEAVHSFSAISIMTVCAMIASKHTAVYQEPSLPEKVAYKRAKTGKRDYCGGFTVISPDRYAPGAANKGESVVRAHWVRGHFKRRKSGVYWWNPHIAGAGELKHRDAYIIKGDSK